MENLDELLYEELGHVLTSYRLLMQYSSKYLDQVITVERERTIVRKNTVRKGKRGKKRKLPKRTKVSETVNPQQELDNIIRDYEALSPEFSEEFYTRASDICQRFEELVPTNDDVEFLIEKAAQDFNEKPLAEAHENAKFWLRPIAFLSGGMAAAALALGVTAIDGSWAAYTAAALYGVSATSAILATKKDTELRRWLAYGSVLAGSLALKGLEVPVDLGKVQGALQIGQIVTFPGLNRAGLLSIEKVKLNRHVKLLRGGADYITDRSLRLSVALIETRKALRYINAVCDSEKRPRSDFQDQYTVFEMTLIKYLTHEASHDDMVASRIKYVPRTEQPKTRRITPVEETSVIKSGYTAEQYARLKAAGAFDVPDVEDVTERSATTEQIPVEQISLNVTYSSEVANADRLAGFAAEDLRDLVECKLTNGYQGTVIRSTTDAKHALRRMWRKHDLEEGTKVFKLQPRGSLRALYTQDGNDIRVLEILTHPEYDALHKKI